MRIQSVRNLNKETWNKFVAYCKLKGVNVGAELGEILEREMKKKFKELLR